MMNIIQRTAIRLLFGKGQKTLATTVPTWQEGQPSYPSIQFESMVKSGWRKNELIFACISKTSNTTSAVSMQVLSQRDSKALTNHPLAILLSNPNPYMSQADLWAAAIIYQKLAGVAYFEKVRSASGRVVQLWPLRPDWVTPLKSAEKLVGGYKFAPPGVSPEILPAEDVLAFRLFDPLNMYQGWPPVAVAARVGDVDNSATDFLKLFFEQGGTPPGLLTTKQKLIDADVTNIRRRWGERYGGHQNWTSPAVLDSDAQYQKIGLDFKEMGFEALDARNEARICMVLDVPTILVGAKVGLDRSTFSNYSEARRSWWEDSLLPLYSHLRSKLVAGLLPDFGTSDIVLEWDFSQVAALQEERNTRWERATSAFRASALTRNQFYAEVGLPEIGPAGDVYVMPMTLSEVTASVAQKELRIEPYQLAAGKGAVAGNAPNDATRRRIEKDMQAALADYFDKQRTQIEVELRSRYAHR